MKIIKNGMTNSGVTNSGITNSGMTNSDMTNSGITNSGLYLEPLKEKKIDSKSIYISLDDFLDLDLFKEKLSSMKYDKKYILLVRVNYEDFTDEDFTEKDEDSVGVVGVVGVIS
jgi:hypothetical protein